MDRLKRNPAMAQTQDTFAAQEAARGAWRRFIDDLAPLRPDLFRYCCGLTGNIWDGEDLAQDVLLRVFSQLGKLNADIERPRAYLLRSATNLWVDRLRRAGLERAHAEAERDEPHPPPADASQVVDVRAAANSLFLALAPQERAAVLLADVLDLSLEETASMLKTTQGAVKSALSRGRARLKAAAAKPRMGVATPRDVVDRFVAALTAKDFDAIRALCLADVTVDMVGGAGFDGYEAGKTTVEYAHMVMPGMGDAPAWRTVDYEGEPIAIGLRQQDGVEGLNEVWRFEVEDGRISTLRLYCFTPDVLVAVAKALGLHVLRRPYRSFPYSPDGPPFRP
jgi:RNA polymerase sigma-70 factor (ECF subfamily)